MHTCPLRCLCDCAQSQRLWRCSAPAKSVTKYNMTTFAMALNELPDVLAQKLPPTDSRLRPDQRLLELGQYDEANKCAAA